MKTLAGAFALGLVVAIAVPTLAGDQARTSPGDWAVYPEVIGLVNTMLDGVPATASSRRRS